MAEGFFSRWSQRKEAVRQGKEIAPEPELREPPPQSSPGGGGSLAQPSTVAEGSLELSTLPAGESKGGGAPAPEPPPTLEEAQLLSRDSDFKRFVQPGVDPEVKNTALRKLFSDPHFNTMDGLDVYIDDYNKPDPLAPEMLKQLASAKFLGLFDDEEANKSPAGGADPDAPPSESVAQSGSRTEQALPPADDHADPDLRLQQDHAPGPEGPGQGTG